MVTPLSAELGFQRFELKGDCRPATERTAAGRNAEPSFFAAAPARQKSVG